LALIDEDMRNTPEARRIFLDLMLKHGNPERGLRRMNELGVLSAFNPRIRTHRGDDAVQHVPQLHRRTNTRSNASPPCPD